MVRLHADATGNGDSMDMSDARPERLIAAAALLVAAGLSCPTAAAELPEPRGEVVLTVTGAIDRTNAEGAARFDRAMLRALPATRYRTGTIWTEGTHEFEGVLLGDLLDAVGASGDTVRATALNEYAITIPVDGEDEDSALVAYEMNGREMSVRNKGPLWIVYPYDSDPDFRTEMIYARSIWQLETLHVTD